MDGPARTHRAKLCSLDLSFNMEKTNASTFSSMYIVIFKVSFAAHVMFPSFVVAIYSNVKQPSFSSLLHFMINCAAAVCRTQFVFSRAQRQSVICKIHRQQTFVDLSFADKKRRNGTRKRADT